MDDTNQSPSEKTRVGFPNANETKKSGNGKAIMLVIIILLILGGATWYLMSNKEETIEFTNDSVTPTITEVKPTTIDEKNVDKKTLKLQVLNGTGTPGDAGKLEKALNELGYTEVVTGNADNYDYKSAEITFASDFPDNYRDEILEALDKLYSDVTVGKESLGEYDAILITGTAVGSKAVTATPKPTSNLTPTTRLTITPTVTRSVTVTP